MGFVCADGEHHLLLIMGESLGIYTGIYCCPIASSVFEHAMLQVWRYLIA